jgi:hypothetical protein
MRCGRRGPAGRDQFELIDEIDSVWRSTDLALSADRLLRDEGAPCERGTNGSTCSSARA